MKTILLVFGYLLICANISFSQTKISGGNVSGLWVKSKSPYQIFGEITIPNNQTLTIEKGVIVEFQGHYKLNVLGRLLAIGNQSDSIVFHSNGTTKWGGIKFVDIPISNDTSKLSYCVVENSYASSGLLPRAATTDDYGGGICMRSSKLKISNSCIRNNKAYIAGGIYCEGNNANIINTVIRNNEAISEFGGLCLSTSNHRLIGCVITNNKADKVGGMLIAADALLINNTICNNISNDPVHGSIFIMGSPKIFNTIIFYNKPNLIHINDQGSYPEFHFCNIENGMAGFLDYYPSQKGNFDGIYNNNIESPPCFMDMLKGNYRLGISSCINTGSSYPVNFIPKYDMDGNPRIFNDSKARIDIGAYEYQGLTPNRQPYCNKMDPQYFLRSQKSKLAINYFDADPDDKLTFKVSTSSPHVTANILSINKSTILTEIVPETNWRGECFVYVNINDNSNSTNSISTDSIKVFISNRFKGDINSKVIFEDTVLVVGDITVKELGDLEIRPGSFVEFQDWYKIKVLGKLNILGSELNKVILTAADTTVLYYNNDSNYPYERGWGGIEFIDVNRTETMNINYCDIKNTGINKEGNQENGTISITNSRNINFNHCTFVSNYAGSSQKKNSGIYAENSYNLQLKNCKFHKGITFETFGAYVNSFGSELIVDSCSFFDTNSLRSFNRHCIYSMQSAVKIKNSSFFNNNIHSMIYNDEGNLLVENCLIKDNNSVGIDIHTQGALVRNNVLINNQLAINCCSNAKIINNLIAYSKYICGCSNFEASAIYIYAAGNPLIANNTIVNNYQDSYNGNTVYASYSSPTVVNNIFWNNVKEGFGYYNGAGSDLPKPIVKNNIIKGINDDLNFNIDPLFRLKDALDYSLSNNSSAINRGLLDVPGLLLPGYDLLGNRRIDITSGKLDIGAYEYSGEEETDIAIQPLNAIEIFPNPTSSVLYLSSIFNSVPYEILNLNGQIVQSGSIVHNAINVNLLVPNTYIIRIKYKNRDIKAKFVKL